MYVEGKNFPYFRLYIGLSKDTVCLSIVDWQKKTILIIFLEICRLSRLCIFGQSKIDYKNNNCLLPMNQIEYCYWAIRPLLTVFFFFLSFFQDINIFVQMTMSILTEKKYISRKSYKLSCSIRNTRPACHSLNFFCCK